MEVAERTVLMGSENWISMFVVVIQKMQRNSQQRSNRFLCRQPARFKSSWNLSPTQLKEGFNATRS